MPVDRDRPGDRRTPVERLLTKDAEREHQARGRPLSRASMQTQRSLEGYLKGGNRPRWMERLAEIEQGMARERRRLERAQRALREECGDDAERFARRWRKTAERWRFGELNDLIEQHNEWFPIERQLPVNPRTGDYVPINGRSYRRRVLDPAWVLEEFPARLRPERDAAA